MNEIELQRLLDGELDHEQRRSLLARLEQPSSDWRRIALALLEEQAWQRELVAIQNDGHAPGSQVQANVERSENLAVPLKSAASNGSSRRWLSMSLAACMLVGVGYASGNWLAGRYKRSTSEMYSDAAATMAVVPPPRELANGIEYTASKPVGHLSFAADESTSTESQGLRVPIYEAAPEHVHHVIEQQQRQVQAWNEQLRRRGFELDWQPEMLESRLPDGRAVIVPVQQVHVRSLGQ